MCLVPFKLNKVALQVVTVNNKEWCKAKETCKTLEYQKKDDAYHQDTL